MTAVVKAMEIFQPGWGFFAEVSESRKVIGKDRAEGAREQKRRGNRRKSRGTNHDKKNNQGDDLIRNGHREQAGEFGFAVRRGVNPMADAGIAMRNSIQGKVAEDGG